MTLSTDAKIAAARQQRRQYEQYEEALAYCQAEQCGATKAVNTQRWDLVTLSGLRYRLNGTVVNGCSHPELRILTVSEELQFARWLEQENRAIKGKNRDEQRQKIVEILSLRRAANKRGGRARVALSQPALGVLANDGFTLPSDDWFVRFFAVYEDIVVEKKQHRESLDRGKKHNETVVENHFFSPAGLKAELLDAGVMNADTGFIDEWRMGWLDEAPNFIDFNSEKGGGQRKVAAGPSDACQTLLPENRECCTVNMIEGLCGFMFGPQVLSERKYVTAEQAAEDDSIRVDTTIFDDRILLPMMCSTYCQMSCTPNGVQTGRSFLHRMELFNKELNDLEQALGRSLRPYVLGMDNATSHKDDAAQRYCASVGIRLWYEESLTSDYLQALDQYNRKFHQEYRKGVKEERRLRNKPTMRISFIDFLLIFSRIWFHWSSPMDRIRSFRKVGITAHGLRPDLVNRSKFTIGELRPDDNADDDQIDITVPSPEGVRKGSQLYYKRKYGAAMEVIDKLVQIPWTPAAGQLLVTTPQPSQTCISNRQRLAEEEFGSYTLKDMGETKRQKKAEAEAERLRIDSNKAAAAEKKEAAAQALHDLTVTYNDCTPDCMCGADEGQCPMLKYKMCACCHQLKKGLCKVRVCVESRKPVEPLALTL